MPLRPSIVRRISLPLLAMDEPSSTSAPRIGRLLYRCGKMDLNRYFDTDYGKQEIFSRRIGSNELNVIKVCAAIADAQRDYYAALHDGASEHQYAQRFRSTAGMQDGLFWEVNAGAPNLPPRPTGS